MRHTYNVEMSMTWTGMGEWGELLLGDWVCFVVSKKNDQTENRVGFGAFGQCETCVTT